MLDDNHLLTLPSGERISFGSNVNFIFETQDLSYASPATVSRMGMIYLNTEDMPIKAILQNFLDSLEGNSVLHTYLPQFFEPCLQKVLTYTLEVKTTMLGIIQNVFSLIRTAKTFNHFCERLIKGFAVIVLENQKNQLTEDLCQIL